jgi:hypothetical protein
MVGPASWVDVGLFSAEGGDFESLAVQVQNAAECGAWENCIGPPAQKNAPQDDKGFDFRMRRNVMAGELHRSSGAKERASG